MKKSLIMAVLLSALIIYVGRKPLMRDRPTSIDDTHAPAAAEGSAELTPNSPPPSPLASIQTDAEAVKQGVIPKQGSFYLEMQKAGIAPVEIDRIVRSCRKDFNFRKVMPGQEYAIFSSKKGELDSLSYRIDREKILRVRKIPDGFAASLDTIPYRIIYQVSSGTIEQSLFASLKGRGADPELAGPLSIIFGWVIDFFKDIRKGDSYTILYEKREYNDGATVLGNILAARITTQGHPFYAFRYKTRKGNWGYYDLYGKSLQKTLLRAPLKYTRITSSFKRSRLHPITHHYRAHLGVDYAAPYGTPIHATGDGTVIAALRNRANGNYVKIRHNRSYITYYLHMSRFAKGIKNGARVRQRQVIGYVGATGLATGPHLDYRIKVNGRFVNPRTIKLPSKSPVPSEEMKSFLEHRDAAISRFMEAGGEEGKTILVKKPVYIRSTRMGAAF